MFRALVLFAILLPATAFAQTAAPADVMSTSESAHNTSGVTDGTMPPAPLGEHICGGYPEIARDNLTTGITTLSFTVTSQGTVSDVKVDTSSGNTQLDSAAMLCVKGWLYKPAMQNGNAVAAAWDTQIGWRIQGDTGASAPDSPAANGTVSVPIWKRGGFNCEGWYMGSKRPQHSVILSFFVEPDGSVKDVAVSQSSGDTKIDADAVTCLSERTYIPAKQGDKPIEVHISDWLY